MSVYTGEYDSTVDAKGRFLLPGLLRKQLPEGETRFVLGRGFEKCLSLYPLKIWEQMIEKIGRLNEFDPSVRKFRRQFLGGATEVELDTAGRLLIPGSLKEYAGLEKDIMIIAIIDKFEIWNATQYEAIYNETSPEEFSELANMVLGSGAQQAETKN